MLQSNIFKHLKIINPLYIFGSFYKIQDFPFELGLGLRLAKKRRINKSAKLRLLWKFAVNKSNKYFKWLKISHNFIIPNSSPYFFDLLTSPLPEFGSTCGFSWYFKCCLLLNDISHRVHPYFLTASLLNWRALLLLI